MHTFLLFLLLLKILTLEIAIIFLVAYCSVMRVQQNSHSDNRIELIPNLYMISSIHLPYCFLNPTAHQSTNKSNSRSLFGKSINSMKQSVVFVKCNYVVTYNVKHDAMANYNYSITKVSSLSPFEII